MCAACWRLEDYNSNDSKRAPVTCCEKLNVEMSNNKTYLNSLAIL